MNTTATRAGTPDATATMLWVDEGWAVYGIEFNAAGIAVGGAEVAAEFIGLSETEVRAQLADATVVAL